MNVINDNLDDEECIDLALNSDFDSALLDCLGEDEEGPGPVNDDLGGGETSDFSHSPARPSSPVMGETHLPRLPSFLLNDTGIASQNTEGAGSASPMTDGEPLPPSTTATTTTQGTSSLPGGDNAYTTVATNENTNPSPATWFANTGASATATNSQMHPLAIQSSASCPPVNNNNNNAAVNSTNNLGMTGMATQNNSMNLPGVAANPSMTAALQAAFTASFMQLTSNPAFNPALVPLACNAFAAGVDLSNFLPQFQAPAYSMPNTQEPAPQQPNQQLPNLQQQQPSESRQCSGPPMASVTTTQVLPQQGQLHGTTKAPSKGTSKHSKSKRRRGGQGSSSNKRSKSGNNASSSSHQRQQPPFQIFDAPVELRHNFIQSQRAHGIPVLEDNNSYHFGMTVNGFHPQRSLDEPYMYKSLSGSKRPLPDPVPIVDARHADAGSNRLKNAKEQKRAHRISELIDQLRVKMERGGWKVGMKSKFHTLSSCSDYVRHLTQVNEEKKAAVQRAKKDLEAKKNKMEEEKRCHQDPSEPESTTSSLTISSRSEQADKKKAASGFRRKNVSSPDKRSRHFQSHESTLFSGSSDDANKQDLRSVATGAVSAVSDITDSNKGGSSSKEGPGQVATPGEGKESDGTIFSEAAVTFTADTRSTQRRHKDVVSNKSDSAPSATDASMSMEKTSLDNDFRLDYEEVFLRSNVPQLLASTNGRIVSFNDFFLKLSGLTRKEVDRLTIFSLVQTSLLANLFDIVAAALRSTSETEESKKDADREEAGEETKESERKLTPLKDYAAITLPCVDFSKAFRDDGRRHVVPPLLRQLYMTVTLMSDSDIRKRCFHCAFTDCPGTKGALGSVTPELLSALFTDSKIMDTPNGKEKKRTAAPSSEALTEEGETTEKDDDGDDDDEDDYYDDFYDEEDYEEEGTDTLDQD